MTGLRRGLRSIVGGAAFTLSLCCVAACTSTPRPSTHPVVLIGVDGLEWKVVLELLAERRLPTLAALMSSGSYGKLRTFKPTLSPIIWTSIATGTTGKRHGIRGFIKPSGGPGRPPRLYRSSDRRQKALWNILSQANRRVDIVGWWNTYPAETVNGVMVAQVNTTTLKQKARGQGIWKGALVAGLSDQVFPPGRQAEMLGVVHAVDVRMPIIEQEIFGDISGKLGALETKLWKQSRWAFRADAIYARVARKLAAEGARNGFDLLAVYFGGADVTGHRFWRYMYPDAYAHKPDSRQTKLLGNVVRDYYAYLDGVIGDILGAAPGSVNVMIVADHGMQVENAGAPFRPNDPANKVISGAHRKAPPAVFIAAGPDIRKSAPADLTALATSDLTEVGSVFDITPTVLALLGRPSSRGFDGDVMTKLLSEAFLRAHPVSYVDSYTEPGWNEHADDAVADKRFKERVDQLRALGYLH